jgi:site-specific DNA-methyltransferase (adenine-specific)
VIVEHLSDRAILYCGDCREVLPTLAEIHAVVSDPPYGIAYQRGPGGVEVSAFPEGGRRAKRIEWQMIEGDNAPFDPAPLLGLAPHVMLWGADHYAARLPRGRWLCWDKLAGREPWDSFSDVEFCWYSRPGAARIVRHLWKGICREGGEGKRVHPNQKPIAVMRWCIEQLPRSCELILDPYMGSGTTGIAALEAGRRFIGIEIDPVFFDVARRRVEAALAQEPA